MTDIFRRNSAIGHRSDDYNELAFSVLVKMQREHFWYQGRHKFLLKAFDAVTACFSQENRPLRAIDLGGGCGGWLEYLHSHAHTKCAEMALADSSLQALTLAESVVGSFASRYQIDLLDLQWKNRWDIAFLLDVLEHIDNDEMVLEQVRESLAPGGLVFVTVPALDFFWSHNDVLAKHKRRYSVDRFHWLAKQSDLRLVRCQYFMFFLSPLLYLSRLRKIDPDQMTAEQITEHLDKTHQVPNPVVNAILSAIFSLEALVSEKLPFPWGTSILVVFQKH